MLRAKLNHELRKLNDKREFVESLVHLYKGDVENGSILQKTFLHEMYYATRSLQKRLDMVHLDPDNNDFIANVQRDFKKMNRLSKHIMKSFNRMSAGASFFKQLLNYWHVFKIEVKIMKFKYCLKKVTDLLQKF